MSYKVLLVGNGAREHAIAKKIVEDNGILFSYMSKENPGIADLSQKFLIGDLNDFKKLDHFKSVDYAIVGPEQPLTEGIADYLEEKLDIPTCSPRKVVSQIESSKIYARKLLDENNLPGNPKYRICSSLDDFKNVIKEFGIEVAIKPDGLTGGKGVRVYGDHFSNYDQAKDYVEILQRQQSQFIVEEKLVGKEFSLQTYADRKTLIPMPIVKDYKRAFDGDKGQNTGSMGSYSLPSHSLPYLSSADTVSALKIMKKTVEIIHKKTSFSYVGVFYGQFMKTDNGIFLVEFNARFGDPEALNVLKIQETGFNSVCLSMIDHNLKKVAFSPLATSCVYLVPEGYPTKPLENQFIEVKDSQNYDLYYASVYRRDNQIFTTKSRAIAVVGTGTTLQDARESVMANIPKIKGKLFHRKDIGLF